MLIPKKDWTVYTFIGNELSRQVTIRGSAARECLSIRYRKGEIQLCNMYASYTNCCFTEKKDTRSPYRIKMNDVCQCYKLHLPGCDCYILTEAFENDYHNSHLDLITELPEEMIDHHEELTLGDYSRDLVKLLSTFLDNTDSWTVFRYLEAKRTVMSIELELTNRVNRDATTSLQKISINYDINDSKILYFECSTVEDIDNALNSIIYKTMHLEPGDYFYEYSELRDELSKKLSKFIIDS